MFLVDNKSAILGSSYSDDSVRNFLLYRTLPYVRKNDADVYGLSRFLWERFSAKKVPFELKPNVEKFFSANGYGSGMSADTCYSVQTTFNAAVAISGIEVVKLAGESKEEAFLRYYDDGVFYDLVPYFEELCFLTHTLANVMVVPLWNDDNGVTVSVNRLRGFAPYYDYLDLFFGDVAEGCLDGKFNGVGVPGFLKLSADSGGFQGWAERQSLDVWLNDSGVFSEFWDGHLVSDNKLPQTMDDVEAYVTRAVADIPVRARSMLSNGFLF